MTQSSIIEELINIAGQENVVTDGDALASYDMDGVSPAVAVFPSDTAQVSEIMKYASAESLSVIPAGSGTKLALGRRPEKADIVLSVRGMDRVIEHEAADLIATAECGVSLQDFRSVLEERKQFLPIDPAHTKNGATLGGIIAANDSGPLRLGYGTARELLIGMKVVRPDGNVFKGGSKVVKNVAGYDLPKLYVGSLGTLGIIVEATFRLYPITDSSATYLAGFGSLDKAHAVVGKLLKSNLVLASLEHMNPGFGSEISDRAELEISRDHHALAIRVMNVRKAVEDQIHTISGICKEEGGTGLVVEEGRERVLWDNIRELPFELSGHDGAVLKAGVLITHVPLVYERIEKLSVSNGVTPCATARAGNGVVMICINGESGSVRSSIEELRELCERAGGSLVVQSAPGDVKSEIDPWGNIGSAAGLMRRIKNNFDPQNIMSPGRLV
jgi:glycolate oxidase FAD binding subunit